MDALAPQRFAATFGESLFISVQQALEVMDGLMLHCIFDYDLHPKEFERFKMLTLFELSFVDEEVALENVLHLSEYVL